MKRFIESIKMDVGYECSNGRGSLAAWALALYGAARFVLACAVCRVHRHKWVDDSTAGPESGSMAAHCERCGDGFHTTLY